MSRQNSEMWLPKYSDTIGMCALQDIIASGADRSAAQRKLSPRSSMHEGKNENIANRIGICRSMGRHPENGEAPALLYSAMVFCWRVMAFSLPGYFSLIALMSGASMRIFAWLL